MRVFIFFFTLFLLSFQAAQKLPYTLEGKIVAVKDGDTYEILYNGAAVVIRLAHVDCPEKKQPFGKNAKKFGSEFCYGKTVKVISEGKTDRNGRLIAEIYFDNRCLNQELVRYGYAWHFKKYSKNAEYAQLEVQAKAKKIGLWSDPNAIAPWEWRHR